MKAEFKHTLTLTKFVLKREKISTLIWLVVLVFLTLVTALGINGIYTTSVDMAGMTETMRNPAMIAMAGPIFDLNNYTIGAMMAQMMLLFTIIAVAFMNIFLVVKHTRKDEESGRVEMIRSLPVGRLSNLSSVLITSVIINVVIALVMGTSLGLLNISTMDFSGSMLYGFAIGISGILFAGITAIFVQVSATSRTALTYSFLFLGGAYLLRAIGDVGTEILSFISPLGLALRTEVYVNNYIWPLVVLTVVTMLAVGFAFYLNSLRDLGAGLIPSKPGRKEAKQSLLSPFGLALRLSKSFLITWAIVMFVLGAAYGSIFGDLDAFLESSEMIQQMFLTPGVTFTIAEQFLSTLTVIYGIVTCIPVVLLLFKVRAEEKKDRLENLLAKKVDKLSILGSYLIIAFISSIAFVFLYGLGLWVAAYSVMTEPISLVTVLQSSMVHLPGIWILLSLGVLIIGLLPKLTKLIWFYLGALFFVTYFGDLLQLPSWIIRTTPFGNIPKLPIEAMNWTPVAILIIISCILCAIGFNAYRRRDIKTN